MARQDEIVRLLRNMNEIISPDPTESRRRQSARELLSGMLDLQPYKQNQSWPGRAYVLVGNSYNVEQKVVVGNHAVKRTACISVVLERGRNNRNCTSIEDAFTYGGFVECLSRFEHDWLKRQPPSTLVGPAYDHEGRLVPHAFAVWRRLEAPVEKTEKVELISH
ncbi:MAG: hypothetical protein K8F91_06455 [Candidatus Obscuribacterales bacterium]|nr:hypothetical protein [Candidatus Obscuribacterales bacterium]